MWNIYRLVSKSVNILDMPKRPQAQPNSFLGLEYEQYGNLVPVLEKFENIIKMLTQILCRMAVTLFPNELMRFRFEAKLIWAETRKHCKHVVVF